MSLYAFDAIDDAIEATRTFLWPFELRRWAKLALVVFFLGGVGGGFNPAGTVNVPSSTGGPGPTTPIPPSVTAITGAQWALIAAIVAIVLVIVVVFLVIGSIMEFVLVESLRTEAVTIRRSWGARWRQGLRLFGFRLVIGLVTLAIVGGLLLAVLAPILFDSGQVAVGPILAAILAFIIVAVIAGLIHGFTTVFVVPIMIIEGDGVLAGWRRLWGPLTTQWKQYGAYLIMGFILQLAAGLVATIGLLIAAVLLAIPFGIIGLVGVGLLSIASLAGWLLIGIAVVLWAVAVIITFLFIAVPIQVYLRYYALFVLGDTDAALDLIPDRRAAIRG